MRMHVFCVLISIHFEKYKNKKYANKPHAVGATMRMGFGCARRPMGTSPIICRTL